jgi:hypothetical protein
MRVYKAFSIPPTIDLFDFSHPGRRKVPKRPCRGLPIFICLFQKRHGESVLASHPGIAWVLDSAMLGPHSHSEKYTLRRN